MQLILHLWQRAQINIIREQTSVPLHLQVTCIIHIYRSITLLDTQVHIVWKFESVLSIDTTAIFKKNVFNFKQASTYTHEHTQSAVFMTFTSFIGYKVQELTQQRECNSKHKDDDSPKHVDDQIPGSHDDEHADQWVVAFKLPSLPLVVGAIDVATKRH